MSGPSTLPVPDSPSRRLIDWGFAEATAKRLAGTGPDVTPAAARAAVASLRRAADAAREPVAQTARMQSPPDAAATLIVDRAGWTSANIGSFQALMDPVVDKLTTTAGPAASSRVAAVGGKVTGAEIGALLAFLSGKVLGQYDLAPGGDPRLMLVAPNIVDTERQLDVDPEDFRLWVAVHEETHRVQFTAVPWLRPHLVEVTRQLSLDIAPTPAEFADRLQQIARRIPQAFAPGSGGLAEIFLTAEQKEQVDGITAVMSLLEGHADVVMDDVGPQVIPSVAAIRARFSKRREGLGTWDRVLRRLLGLEGKMRQYRDGAAFVRGVVKDVGVDGFNAVWTSPQTLPSPDEIAHPASWVRRVHG